MNPTVALVVVCLIPGIAGCDRLGVEEASPGNGIGSRSAALNDVSPPRGSNGLPPSCFWSLGAQKALRSLGAAALDQGGGHIQVVPLTDISADCRIVLRDTVQCALPVNRSVTDPVTGEVYGGWWGLAPTWKDGALDGDGRRYVTACLVERLNFSGNQVPILLEGPPDAIAHDARYDADYPIQESTAFGDLFSSTAPLLGLQPAFNAYVCWEDLIPDSNGPLGLPLLGQRICDNVPLCGLVTLGPCVTSCVANGPYWECAPSLLSPPWIQTVRVKLTPAGAN
jgi:hypothetical protein